MTSSGANLVADSVMMGADGANPLPSQILIDLALPREMPFRRIYGAFYHRDATICSAVAEFTLWNDGVAVVTWRVGANQGAVSGVLAGGLGKPVQGTPRLPFQITDTASGSGFQDTVASGIDCQRFVWRVNSRDISAVCHPVRITAAANRLTARLTGDLVVATGSTLTAVLAAGVISSEIP